MSAWLGWEGRELRNPCTSREFAQALVNNHKNDTREFENRQRRRTIRPRTLPTRRCQRFASTSKWLSRLPVGKRPLTDVAAASASRHQQANFVRAIRLNNADGKSGRLRAFQESGGEPQRSTAMCDYSLMHVKSRPASIGDKLRTSNFGTGTRGFAAPGAPQDCDLPPDQSRAATHASRCA